MNEEDTDLTEVARDVALIQKRIDAGIERALWRGIGIGLIAGVAVASIVYLAFVVPLP